MGNFANLTFGLRQQTVKQNGVLFVELKKTKRTKKRIIASRFGSFSAPNEPGSPIPTSLSKYFLHSEAHLSRAVWVLGKAASLNPGVGATS